MSPRGHGGAWPRRSLMVISFDRIQKSSRVSMRFLWGSACNLIVHRRHEIAASRSACRTGQDPATKERCDGPVLCVPPSPAALVAARRPENCQAASGRVLVSFEPGATLAVDKSAGTGRAPACRPRRRARGRRGHEPQPLFGDMLAAFDDPAVRADLARHYVLRHVGQVGRRGRERRSDRRSRWSRPASDRPLPQNTARPTFPTTSPACSGTSATRRSAAATAGRSAAGPRRWATRTWWSPSATPASTGTIPTSAARTPTRSTARSGPTGPSITARPASTTTATATSTTSAAGTS